jgi:hypothetical protein
VKVASGKNFLETVFSIAAALDSNSYLTILIYSYLVTVGSASSSYECNKTSPIKPIDYPSLTKYFCVIYGRWKYVVKKFLLQDQAQEARYVIEKKMRGWLVVVAVATIVITKRPVR